jgi:CRP-like cAMP-binding protein
MSKNVHPALLEERDLLPSTLASRNKIFGQLAASAEVRDYLLPHLKIVSLERNQVLYEQGDTIQSIYLPLDSVVSNLAIMEDGTTLETLMIGRESLVGVSAILGSGVAGQWMWVCISGMAIQLDAKLIERVFVRNETALKALLKGYRALMQQVSQRCVCNTRHTVLERLCCWLLMVHDRVGDTNLRLTQEMISTRVGARRAGITVAAGLLQSIKAIEYRRGQLHIIDREVLERAVCECYSVLQVEFPEDNSNRPARVNEETRCR